MVRFLLYTAFILMVGSVASAQTPTIGGCTIFPSNNVWNTPIDKLPVSANSANYVQSIGGSSPLHPDFGSASTNGIPYTVVNGSQTPISLDFAYAGESDAGPYPMPASPSIEGGSDHHILLIDTANCTDYEIDGASPNGDGTWSASSGAIFDLSSNQLRPSGWTSADAAGLPVLPGLVRYDEVASGVIHHAIRFTAPRTDNSFIWPARHEASWFSGAQYPPMGARFRLKASFDVSSFPPSAQVILNAMKQYGIILADNGSPWFISGVPDSRWSDDDLHSLTFVKGSDLEAVDESALMQDPNSAAVKQTTNAPDTGIGNQWVNLVSRNSGKCLESTGSLLAAFMQQWSCSTSPDQRFLLTPVDGGYKISVQSSGFQLDVDGGPSATSNGTPVIQYPYWGGSNEIWTVTPASTAGYYNLHPANSGKCLDVSGISQSDGAMVWVWSCWGGANQDWQLKP